MRELQNWMLENLDKDLGTPEMASRVAMSVRSFNRCFKKETGTTPTAFLMRARIEAAKRMLPANLPPWEMARKQIRVSGPRAPSTWCGTELWHRPGATWSAALQAEPIMYSRVAEVRRVANRVQHRATSQFARLSRAGAVRENTRNNGIFNLGL